MGRDHRRRRECGAQCSTGTVRVDATGLTSVPGLWAVGNVVSSSANVPVSMASGSVAGATINGDLIKEEIRADLAQAG